MGLKRKIYLDSCMVMYLVEEDPHYHQRIARLLSQRSIYEFVYSPLVELECLVKPLRGNDSAKIKNYKDFFTPLEKAEMPDEVYAQAAKLRAFLNLKTPDALHLATADFHGCHEFWTNDHQVLTTNYRQLLQFSELQVVNILEVTI